MPFVHPSLISILAFLAVVAAVLIMTMAGLRVAYGKSGDGQQGAMKIFLAALAWIALSSLFVWSGAVEANPIPAGPIFFVSVNAAALVFSLSRVGRKLALGVPVTALVAFQGFRLPLELVLHSWASQGTIPESMTWTGQNIDIIAGIVALGAAPFAARSRALAWAANVTGFALLLNVMRVAVLSSPFPFGWDVEPKLKLVFYMPYALIGSVCVAGALAGHVVLTRALLMRRYIHSAKR